MYKKEHHGSAKMPYIPAKEPHIPAKEPHIPAKEPYSRDIAPLSSTGKRSVVPKRTRSGAGSLALLLSRSFVCARFLVRARE